MANVRTKVLLFQDDYERVKEWVLLYPDRETGGQMFGLWTHDKKPYINVITGPGKNCRHGTHSFHQDIEYLQKVGHFLNSEFMLCHIGEWHSHHQLRLRQPSSGDLNSIWKHFPAGVEHFLLIIATIEDGGVRLNPWLFTASTHTHDLIGVEIIKKDNVFRLDDVVENHILEGAELSAQNKPKDVTLWSVHDEFNEWEAIEAKSKEVKRPTEPKHSKWYDNHWGVMFVQLLHSKLEKHVKDSSSKIDMSSEKDQGCLQFSFQRNTCRLVITFPPDFPHSGLGIVGHVPESQHPFEWYEFMEHGQSDEDFVDKIVHELKQRVPNVHNTVAGNYCAIVK